MTPFDFGVVVLIQYPFTDLSGSRRRPAVVVSGPAYIERRPDVIVMPITSQLRAVADSAETFVVQWASAGLLKPSTVKPVIFTIKRPESLRTIGLLAESDRDGLRRNLNLILG